MIKRTGRVQIGSHFVKNGRLFMVTRFVNDESVNGQSITPQYGECIEHLSRMHQVSQLSEYNYYLRQTMA